MDRRDRAGFIDDLSRFHAIVQAEILSRPTHWRDRHTDHYAWPFEFDGGGTAALHEAFEDLGELAERWRIRNAPANDTDAGPTPGLVYRAIAGAHRAFVAVCDWLADRRIARRRSGR